MQPISIIATKVEYETFSKIIGEVVVTVWVLLGQTRQQTMLHDHHDTFLAWACISVVRAAL